MSEAISAWWYLLGTVSAGIPFCLYVYVKTVAQVPRLHSKPDGAFKKLLLEHCPSLSKPYIPTWWCPFGIMQTAFRQILRSRPSMPFEREIVSFEDGGQLAVDWLHPSTCNDNAPIVILLPGITGSTHDCSYILHVVQEATKLGYRSLVINPRGLGGIELLTPKTYNAAVTEDTAHVIKMVNERFPKATCLGVGFSMGGMILWNYLAKCQSAEETGLKAAMMVSSPWDPMDATFTIEEFFPRLFFNGHLAKNLRSIVTPYKTLFESRVDWNAVMNVKTVRDFDMAFVVPNFGYKDWPEYYHDAALYYKVHRIPIPMFCVNAADDCFSPLKSIPFDELSRSENVAVAITQHGGHTAFMSRFNPSDPGLIEELFIEYSRLVFQQL